MSKYDNLLFLDDFKLSMEDKSAKTFVEIKISLP